MNDEIVELFVEKITSVRQEIITMFLFGSRCRNDWRPDSDYDILIVLPKKDRVIINSLYDAVIDVLISTGKLISLKIFAESEFNRLKSIPTPFMVNILKEGKRIGYNN